MCINKTLKSVFILVLCGAISFFGVTAIAENVEKASIEVVEYYLVEGSGENEILTPTDNFAANGVYRAKAGVYNYAESESISVLMLTGLFDKETKELLQVKFAKDNIAAGDTVYLTADIEVTNYESQTVESYIWKSANALKPLGNTAPTAPKDVTVDLDKVTNSTVELFWIASIDDTDSVSYYNVYRDGEFVGKAIGETSFRDVGIRHNTEVSYTVEAVDDAGAVSAMSESTDVVKTDDIARLWFGAAASHIAEGETSIEITADDTDKIFGYNMLPTHIVTGDVAANDGKAYTTSLEAVNQHYKYEGEEELGISAIKFNPNMSRVLASISEGDFLDALKAKEQDEIKIVMNYFDFRPVSHTYVDSTGKNFSDMIRYSYSSLLNGTTGVVSSNGQKWYTKILTVPTTNNTQEGFAGNSSSMYEDVFKDRPFDYSNVNSSGTRTAATDGKDAMFGIGNSSGSNAAFISKIEIGMKDYVPYGAVLDFDMQEETQFVELLKRDGFNGGSIVTKEGKMAIELDNTNEKNRLLRVGMSDSYITSADNNLIIRITYLDDQVDENDTAGLTVAYDDVDGGAKSSRIIRREGTNTWKTQTFTVDNAALSNANGSLQLGTGFNSGANWYISRVEIIKR